MSNRFDAPVHLRQGAFRLDDGSVQWTVWAPLADHLHLILWQDDRQSDYSMTEAGDGYWTYCAPGIAEGTRYAYRLPDGAVRPDPASRWQPDSVHRPSAVFFPDHYSWTDAHWRGIPADQLVIYELHIGTFTAEGTFDAAAKRLADLAELGITAIEIMPISQFPGDRNWGYDGVHPYAAQSTYGGPRGLQRLVDAAHRVGLAVFLDVVYNHFGPEGNYMADFGPYFTDHHHTPWGRAINYDGPYSEPVRSFVVENACQWVRDFHVDGLRLDAVQTIYDLGATHILAEIQEGVQQVAARLERRIHVIAETNQNDRRLLDPPERGGYGLDGVWADDFHHAVHTLLTGETEGYYLDYGTAGHLRKAFETPFVYDGNYSPFRRRRHGSPTTDLARTQFVVCVQNHDQVGNRMLGERFAALLSPAQQRLAAALLLVSPYTPLLFMGEEYGEQHPFPFFCSFTDEGLIEAVRKGRREEFAACEFNWEGDPPDPQSEATFDSARLTWSWPEGSPRAGLRALYRELLAARRQWPPLVQHAIPAVSLRGSSSEAACLYLEHADAGFICLANLTDRLLPLPADISQVRLFSSEDPRFAGGRTSATQHDLLPYELQVFGPGA